MSQIRIFIGYLTLVLLLCISTGIQAAETTEKLQTTNTITIDKITISFPADWKMIYDPTIRELEIFSPSGCMVGMRGKYDSNIDVIFIDYVKNMISLYPDFAIISQDNTTFSGYKANRFEGQWSVNNTTVKKTGYFVQYGDDFVEIFFDGPSALYDKEISNGTTILNNIIFA